MLDGTAQYKIFTLDGGGGTSIFGQGQPYFWGTRAITPNDPLPGLFKWTKETYPERQDGRVSSGWDIGEPNNTHHQDRRPEARSPRAATSTTASTSSFPVGNQDFSPVFPKIKANEPDILLLGVLRPGPRLVRQPVGHRRPEGHRLGFEFTPDGVNASKGTYDKVGWTFAYDYFDADNPTSPLAKLFVERVQEGVRRRRPTSTPPTSTRTRFVMWEVIRRVLKNGGDINDGDALDKALQDEPDRRQRLRRRRQHRRHLHPRPDDPLGDQARDGCVRVQGRQGHAEGVLRHRRCRLQDGLTGRRRTDGAPGRAGAPMT